ncbi:hypothetical protein [Streptomyces sp. NPDC001404]|uniref:hypothetical protein n=1 Tax=Streptomyces sp. NPDC001404 TaxID=3364571 RepID=UPI0036BFA96C
MTSPLPDGTVIMDPVLRRGRYLAVGTQTPGHFTVRWHAWDADGAYIGFATDPGLLSLLIAQHERHDDQ